MLRRVPTRHAKRVLAGRYRACRSPSLSYASVSPSRPNIVRSPFVLHNPAAKRVIEIPRPTPPAVAATRSDSRQLNASHPCSCLPATYACTRGWLQAVLEAHHGICLQQVAQHLLDLRRQRASGVAPGSAATQASRSIALDRTQMLRLRSASDTWRTTPLHSTSRARLSISAKPSSNSPLWHRPFPHRRRSKYFHTSSM